MSGTEAPSEPLATIRGHLKAATDRWAACQTIDEIRADFEVYLKDVGPRGAAIALPLPVDPGLGFKAAWIGSGLAPMLYCHGGGFQIGGIASHSSLIARLAEASDTRILAFDYRLAPEHRYPAAADDSLAAYRWMVDENGPPLALIGDSAGGALALLTSQRARDAGLPQPGAIVLISPWLDLSMQGDSYTRLADQDVFSKSEQLRVMARSYLGRNGPPATSPEASPLWGDLSGLAPILIHAGSADITLDDSITLAERTRSVGGKVELRVFENMCHHFQIFESLPDAKKSLDGIAEFLKAV